MKRYLNKAIIYKEFKCCSLWMLWMFPFVMLNGYSKINTLKDRIISGDHQLSFAGISNYFTFNQLFPFVFIFVIAIAHMVMGSDRNGDYERIGAMPFTRKELIISKLVVGELLLIIPLLINFIMVLVVYLLNYDVMYPYINVGILTKIFILNVLNYSAMVIFLMLIQSICGKKGVGTVLGLIFMFIPVGLLLLIGFFVGMHLEALKVTVNLASVNADKIISYLLVPLYNQLGMFQKEIGYLPRVIVLICLICIFIALTYYSYTKNQFERIGNVLMFSFLEPILKIGVAVCSALSAFGITYAIVVEITPMWKRNSASVLIIPDIVTIAIGLLAYFVTYRLIKINKE